MALPEVKVRITADDKGLEKGLNRAATALSGFAKKAAVGAVVSVGALATGFIWASKRAIDFADTLAKTSQRIGTTTENLSRLEYAARLSGGSLGDLTTAFTYLSRYMKDSSDKFDELGIAVRNSDGTFRDTNDVFMEVAEVISRMPDGARKTALAYDLMGRSATILIPLMNAGKAGIKGMGDEADRLGVTVSTKFGKASERFNDNLTRIKTAMEGIVNVVSGDLIGYLEEFTSNLVEWIKDKDAVKTAAAQISNAIIAIGRAAASAAEGINTLIGWGEKIASNKLLMMLIFPTAAPTLFADWIVDLAKADEKAKALLETVQKTNEAAKSDFGDFGQDAGVNNVGPTGPRMGGPTGDQMDRLTALKDEWAQERELTQDRLDFLRESMMSEREMLVNEYNEQQNLLTDSLNQKLLSETEYAGRRRQLEQRLQDDLGKMDEMRRMQAMSATSTLFGGLAQLATVGGKKLFNIAKAFSIAEAVMNTAVAITKAMTTVPWPFSLVAAAGAAAAGAAQIATIAATSPGGGGGGIKSPSASGGAGAASAAAASPSSDGGGGGRQTQVALQLTGGDMFGRDQVISLINAINEAQEDGAVVRLV